MSNRNGTYQCSKLSKRRNQQLLGRLMKISQKVWDMNLPVRISWVITWITAGEVFQIEKTYVQEY